METKHIIFEKSYEQLCQRINVINKERNYKGKSVDDLSDDYNELRKRAASLSKEGRIRSPYQIMMWTDKDLNVLANAFLLVEELIAKTLKLQVYPTQRKAAFALLHAHVIDMKTGEGKTLVGLLCACIQHLYTSQVFIITANDYLSQRDYNYAKEIFSLVNIEANYIDPTFTIEEKRLAYRCDIIYVNNQTLLRDFIASLNATKKDKIFMPQMEQINGKYRFPNTFAIIDEIDYVLLDEGKSFFTQSKRISRDEKLLQKAYDLATQLKSDMFYIDNKTNSYHLNEKGLASLCDSLSISQAEYFASENKELRKLILRALDAIYRYKNEIDYLVQDDAVYTINKETGRLNTSTRLADGVHQLLEVKEGVPIQDDVKAICGTTYPEFYECFSVFCGMSGTIATEEQEMLKQYQKQVITIPSYKPLQRIDREDIVCKSQSDKEATLLQLVKDAHKKQQPVLLVVNNIEEGSKLLDLFTKEKLKAKLLSAKNHKEEASIMSKAGIHNHITIATIMAGRGVDIVCDKLAKEAGGLLVIGTGHFYSKRIDNQIKGRTGRQGERGETVFTVYLGDEISSKFVDKIGTLSFAEEKMKDIFHMEKETSGYGEKQMKRMYDEAQKEQETADREMRATLMNMFRILSREYIDLFAQKNDYLLGNKKEKLSILNQLQEANQEKHHWNKKEKEPLEKITRVIKDRIFANIITLAWEDFFEEDRFYQRQKLTSSVQNENYIYQYQYDNRLRWQEFLTGIRNNILKEVNTNNTQD